MPFRIFPSLTPREEFTFLRGEGLRGSINDMQFKYLRNAGYTGGLNSMLWTSFTNPIAAVTTHRYWRVRALTNSGNPTYVGIADLQMRESVGGADVTTEGFAIEGSHFSTFEDTLAFDANLTGTWWLTLLSNAPEDAWVGQDFGLGNEKTIAEIVLTARTDASNFNQMVDTFEVEYSDDAITWTSLYSGNAGTWTSGSSQTFALPDQNATAIQFGELTPVGAGGYATTSADGTYGEFTAASGIMSPNTSPLTVVSGQVVGDLVIDVITNEASALPSEIGSVWTSVGVGTTAIKVRDGTVAGDTHIEPAAKAFTSLTIEPYGYVANADPRLSTRPVTIPGIRFADTQSNVTVRGFDMYNEANTHICGRNAGGGTLTNVHFIQCEIRGRDFTEMWTTGDMTASFPTAAHGVTMSSSVSCSVDTCYIHDVMRGTSEGGSTDHVVKDCYIIDVYQNFTNNVSSLRAVVQRNMCQHVWGANHDVGLPHAGAGGSWGQQCTDALMEDNVFDSGNNRQKLHTIHFNAGTLPPGEPNSALITMAATGAKMNEDGVGTTPNYINSIVRNNLVRTRGLGIEVAHGSSAKIHNNTIVTNGDISGGSLANLAVSGLYSGSQAYNNVTPLFYLSTADDNGSGSGYPATFDDLSGDSNVQYSGYSDALVFAGDSIKGFSDLDIDELVAAYTPLAGTAAVLRQSGFTYSNDTYVAPTPTGGTPTRLDQVNFGGTVRGSASISGTAIPLAPRTLQMTFAIRPAASDDAGTSTIFELGGDEMHIDRLASGRLSFYVKAPNDVDVVMNASSYVPCPADEWSYVYFSVDVDTGDQQLVINGVNVPFFNSNTPRGIYDISGRGSSAYIGANSLGTAADYYDGDVELMAVAWDEAIIDMSTVAGMNELYASDGTFRDLGTAGANTTPTWTIWLESTGTTMTDRTGNTTWTVTGLTTPGAGGLEAIDMTGVALDLNGEGVGLEPSFVLAMRLTKKNAATMYLFNSGTVNSDTRWLLRVEDDHYFTLESNTGTRLFSGALFGSLAVDDTQSIYIRVESGDIEVIIDGVSVFTDATTYATVKGPRYLFTGDGGTTSADPILHGGFWVSNDTPAYSDLFDGSNLPLWTGTTLGSFTALAAPTTAAEVNALSGVTGTATVV